MPESNRSNLPFDFRSTSTLAIVLRIASSSPGYLGRLRWPFQWPSKLKEDPPHAMGPMRHMSPMSPIATCPAIILPMPTAIASEVYTSMGLTESEFSLILKLLGREPTLTEIVMFAVMWSEHCGYKY